jgi:hypothetical protein
MAAVTDTGQEMTDTCLASAGSILRQLLSLHAPRSLHTLDCTYGAGVIWRGLDHQPVRMDCRHDLEDRDVPADWADIPHVFGPASFDLIVFDSPRASWT